MADSKEAKRAEWIDGVVRQLHKAFDSRYFGRMTIEIFDGEIARIELIRSIKNPRDLGDKASEVTPDVAHEIRTHVG